MKVKMAGLPSSGVPVLLSFLNNQQCLCDSEMNGLGHGHATFWNFGHGLGHGLEQSHDFGHGHGFGQAHVRNLELGLGQTSDTRVRSSLMRFVIRNKAQSG